MRIDMGSDAGQAVDSNRPRGKIIYFTILHVCIKTRIRNASGDLTERVFDADHQHI